MERCLDSTGATIGYPAGEAVLPAALAPPFIITGVLFRQVHLVAAKGWSLPEFAATYPLFAAGATAAALGAGFLIDRFGALRLVPVYLVPLGLGLFVLQMGNAPITAALLDLRVGLPSQLAVLSAYSLCCAVVLGLLLPRLKHR